MRRPVMAIGDRCQAARHAGYATDGTRLFRVVAPLRPELGDAILEDCSTLRWRAYDFMELWRLRLRPVGPDADLARAGASTSPA